MAQPNKTYRQTLSGSIGAGMSSVFKPNSRRYYILEHKVTSKYHRAGEAQEIIVDQIELGRDSHCQVRFDDHFSTVSRHHAAIVKDGDGWKLVQVSKTNTTLLNGHPVRTEWYLQNGDEIQLSINGPKLGFIIPTGNKATVGSIGLTRRLSLFRQQALRPYKKAIMSMAALLVLALGIGGFVIYKQDQQIKDNSKLLAEAKEANANNEKLIEAQKTILENQNAEIDSIKKIKPREIIREKTVTVTVPSPPQKTIVVQGGGHGGGTTKQTEERGRNSSPDPLSTISKCYPSIYHITAIPYLKGNDEPLKDLAWTGTGFLLSDGKFVTARHVTSPYYSNDFRVIDGIIHVSPNANDGLVLAQILYNVAAQSGHALIKFHCVNGSGHSIDFTSDQVQDVGTHDDIQTLAKTIPLDEGMEIPAGTKIRHGATGAYDYSYVQIGGGGLRANRNLSTNLKQGTKLYVLGYPHSIGTGQEPVLSEAICAQNGLSKEKGSLSGTIMASNDNTESGNSGGPILVYDNGNWEVVAIVSGGTYQKGRFVPISMIP